jgi:hypothetical protein
MSIAVETPRIRIKKFSGEITTVAAIKWTEFGKGLKAAVVMVTPELAKELLSSNDKNRHLRPTTKARYMRAMAANKWRLNGEPIIISRQGRLLNGQHRLWACIESEHCFETVMIAGVDTETFRTMDTGRVRMASDVLSIGGHKNATTLSGIVNFLWEIVICKGALHPRWEERPDHATIEKLVDERPGLIESATAVNAFTWQPLKNSTFGLVHYLCGEISKKARDDFFDRLDNGTGLAKGDPIHALRRRLETESRSRSRLNRTLMAALAIKAWNLWRTGKPVDRGLTWRADNEPFPVAK